MHKFTLPHKTKDRIKEFTLSPEAQNLPDYSLSEYWKHETEKYSIGFSEDHVVASGDSGNYVPQRNWDILDKIIKITQNPNHYLPIARGEIFLFLSKLLGMEQSLSHMSASSAFDAVMNHAPISDPDLSPFRINFLKLKKKHGVIASSKELKREYFKQTGLQASHHIIIAYYQFNIISGLLDWNRINTILEIGAGNGNLASIIHHNQKKKYIIVDLPRTLCLSMSFLAGVFPEAELIMPHEAQPGLSADADFTFLTPAQIHLIPDNHICLAINDSSFNEMRKEQIKAYFDLISRVCRNGGYFYTRNRVEKIPGGSEMFKKECTEPVIRFPEYPWDGKNNILAYEVCRLTRLIQRDNAFIRLEQIVK